MIPSKLLVIFIAIIVQLSCDKISDLYKRVYKWLQIVLNYTTQLIENILRLNELNQTVVVSLFIWSLDGSS